MSDDDDSMDDLSDVADNQQYHVTKFTHARTVTVNIEIEGGCDDDRLEFEREGNREADWDCSLDIDPKYDNSIGGYVRTDPQFRAAKLRHDDPGESDEIGTEISHKSDNKSKWQSCDCDFGVDLV